ncbi:phage neck terminator protein [Erwinia sp. CGal63]|uniref:phage neck terminator protein n=1 Tax=Erwinia sp. CGal63 TaxID=2919889 RepID=UPI00300A37A1
MITNTSKRAGWLTPLDGEPACDAALEEQISAWIQGITGLAENRVAVYDGVTPPVWLPEDGNGCAFMVMNTAAEGTPVLSGQQQESARLERDENMACLLRFYGPSAQLYATRFRDGIALTQNIAELKKLSLSVKDCSDIATVLETVNNAQTRRYELTVNVVRKIFRLYGICSLVETPVQIFGE